MSAFPEKVSPGEVLLFRWIETDLPRDASRRGFGTFAVSDPPGDGQDSPIAVQSRFLAIQSRTLTFETREEALLHWESLGIVPREIPFEPVLRELYETGTVRRFFPEGKWII